MKKKLTLTNLCMNLMQSYAIFRPVANFLAFISPTCSDNRPYRRQINVFNHKCVANSVWQSVLFDILFGGIVGNA